MPEADNERAHAPERGRAAGGRDPFADYERPDVRTNHANLRWSPAWLGSAPSLYRPELWQPAADIPVHRFRQIYIWPLVLHAAADRDSQPDRDETDWEVTRKSLNSKDCGWQEIDDLLDHLPRKNSGDCAASYSEFVYFHDYVQQMLFRPSLREDSPLNSLQPSGPEKSAAPLHLFRRADVKRAEITLAGRRYSVDVSRCNLYLFRNRTAVLALEFDSGPAPRVQPQDSKGESRPASLADVQVFIDHARRCYTPFFDGDKPMFVPERFVWLNEAGQPVCGGETRPKLLCDEFCRIKSAKNPQTRTAPVFDHWRQLLKPLIIAGYESDDNNDKQSERDKQRNNGKEREPRVVWRQVVDERIPTMTYVSLTGAGAASGQYAALQEPIPWDESNRRAMLDMRTVSRADWIRLCFADPSGTDPLPYDPGFLGRFEEEACYDRHFPSEAATAATRYMFSGYQFAAVGAGWFFDNHGMNHFRRHYFQMGLILQMEFASLLAVSSRISEAVRSLHKQLASTVSDNDAARSEAYKNFRDEIIGINEKFLEALHLFRFTGLSNQLQPREMYAKWRKALDLDDLFEDLKEELDAASQFLLAGEQVRRAEAANSLSTIAAIGVVFGLAFSFLGMNVLVSAETMQAVLLTKEADGWTRFARELLPAGLVVAIAGTFGMVIANKLVSNSLDNAARKTTRTVLEWTIVIGICAASIGASAYLAGSAK